MTTNSIIVSHVLSNRSDAMVWAVYVQGTEEYKNYCKNAYSAMKYAFMIKAQHGLQISDNCLTRLSHQIAMEKKAKAEKIQQVAVELAEKYSVNKVLQIAEKVEKLPRKRSKVVKSTKLGLKDIEQICGQASAEEEQVLTMPSASRFTARNAIEKMHVAASQ